MLTLTYHNVVLGAQKNDLITVTRVLVICYFHPWLDERIWMARVPKTGKKGEEKVRKWGRMEGCRLRLRVKWSDAVRKVRPAHPHRLAGKPATPDASKPVRRGTETRRGHGERDGRPSRRLLMSFSLVAEGRGGGGSGGLLIRSTAPANWPANARQLRLMSLPTQINASATTLWMSQLIWRRFCKELSNLFMHFMIYVNERGGCN